MSIQYLRTLPLTDALFWYIENVGDETPDRNAMFFHLRERMREQPSGGVLAVLDGEIQDILQGGGDSEADALIEARAAVAELIDCAAAMQALAKGPTGGVTQAQKRAIVDRMDAALARMGGSQ